MFFGKLITNRIIFLWNYQNYNLFKLSLKALNWIFFVSLNKKHNKCCHLEQTNLNNSRTMEGWSNLVWNLPKRSVWIFKFGSSSVWVMASRPSSIQEIVNLLSSVWFRVIGTGSVHDQLKNSRFGLIQSNSWALL